MVMVIVIVIISSRHPREESICGGKKYGGKKTAGRKIMKR